MRRSNAFTLIELLVVISIIALLISILLPVLGAARLAAMDVQCKSNQHQLITADSAYLADHHEFSRASEWVDSFDIVATGRIGGQPDPSSEEEIEDGSLFDYMSSTLEAYFCPIGINVLNPDNLPSTAAGDTYARTYSKNAFAGGPGKFGEPGRFYSDYGYLPLFRTTPEKLKGGASEFAVFMEENDFTINGYGGAAYNDGILFVPPGSRNNDCLASFHNMGGGDLTSGKGYVAFADGHVEARSYREPDAQLVFLPDGTRRMYTATGRLVIDGVPID